MPLYTYACYSCNKVYEVQVKLADYDKTVKCPHCGKELERHIDPVTFVLR